MPPGSTEEEINLPVVRVVYQKPNPVFSPVL